MLLIYGATGYTGKLVVDEAIRRGLTPIVAGRDAAKVAEVGARTGLPTRTFPVDAPDLTGVTVLLNIAGPFSRTAKPMIDACLRAGVHYLDVTGEIAVFEACAARDAEAKAAGILVMPGVGFDVVPTDCMAAHLQRRLPTATSLRLALGVGGGISHGTATTAAENLDAGGAVRKGGKLTRVPSAYKTLDVDFGRGPRTTVTIPWGDVSTAYRTTGIPDIEVYAAFPSTAITLMKLGNYAAPLLRAKLVKGLVQAWIDAQPPGPTDAARARGHAVVWGDAADDAGNRVAARLTTPEGYTLTAITAIEAAMRVDAGTPHRGFGTPAGVFGADFVLGFTGVTLEDLS